MLPSRLGGNLRGKAIMVQGTSSSVGKSWLVTALCRILHQEGLHVAPFKAQNMSLNSAATPDGREISRAQAIQAEAAGVAPEAIMNPILLKPATQRSSQIVVLGRPLQTVGGREYRESYVPRLQQVVEDSLRQLLQRFDAVVIEGAGSPAEVNLRDRDIANMHVAALAGAPVLLVGDVDRGGMLASVVGTLELLAPEERDLVAALVVNKFRGDPALLRPGLDFLEQRTGKPVIGLIPYVSERLIDEEDSVALDDAANVTRDGPAAAAFDGAAAVAPQSPTTVARHGAAAYDPVVAILRLPHIANFTDFHPLERQRGVSVRYIQPGQPIGQADACILPGSKSTLADLRYLRENGYAQEILALSRRQIPIIGICGGYQMLGMKISDPLGVEAEAGGPGSGVEAEGLGLLNTVTVFLPEKTTERVEGEVLGTAGFLGQIESREVRGYEIHMGTTVRLPGAAPLLHWRRRGQQEVDYPEGAVDPSGLVMGTYLHDLFENDGFRVAFVNWLRRRRGLAPVPPLAPIPPSLECNPAAPEVDPARDRGDDPHPSSALARKEQQYDRLASLVRAHLDMSFIYRLLELQRASSGQE